MVADEIFCDQKSLGQPVRARGWEWTRLTHSTYEGSHRPIAIEMKKRNTSGAPAVIALDICKSPCRAQTDLAWATSS